MPDKNNFNAVVKVLGVKNNSCQHIFTETAPTVLAGDDRIGGGGSSAVAINENGLEEVMEEVKAKRTVRRLTPTECARLQGFADDWLEIGEWVDTKGKTHKDADSPKYKALGNSIAVGFENKRRGYWTNIIKRISATYDRTATMGSLFSGIGGFDLAWTSVNGVGSVRWSSEIEEFPIAVLKKHFGDVDAEMDGDVKEYL